MDEDFAFDEQLAVRVTLMRGGTSKGLYFRFEDLPTPGAERDAILKALIGSEDLLQIDGLGGSRLVTAKLAIVGPRIASPEMLPSADPLPHVICSPPVFAGGGEHEADQHDDTRRVGCGIGGPVCPG